MVDTGYLARVPVLQPPGEAAEEHHVRDFDDACYLTGIAHLARRGLIRLRSSGELQMEQWRLPVGQMRGYSLFAKNLFQGVDITPVDRMPDFVMGPTCMGYPDIKVQQRDRLKSSNDTLYEAIVRRLGAKSSQDAWHIRTAEIHNMYCFLTVDHKLINNVTAQSKHEPLSSLTTKVLRPAELGRTLGLWPLSPRYVSLQDASFPVRADLAMPGNKRRPGKQGRPG